MLQTLEWSTKPAQIMIDVGQGSVKFFSPASRRWDVYGTGSEDIQICQYYVKMKVLIPMDVAVAEIIEGGIAECARFGDFLDENYYVTNVRIPSEAEILRYIREMGRGKG